VEDRKTKVHPKVFEAVQDPKDPALLEQGLAALRLAPSLPEGARQREMLAWFMKLVPVYRPSPSGLGRYLQEEVQAPRGAHRPVHAPQEGPLGVPG
jgi:hypothetical protein